MKGSVGLCSRHYTTNPEPRVPDKVFVPALAALHPPNVAAGHGARGGQRVRQPEVAATAGVGAEGAVLQESAGQRARHR